MIREALAGVWNAIPPLLGAPGGWDYSKPPWWNRFILSTAGWLLARQDERRVYTWVHPEIQRELDNQSTAFRDYHSGRSWCDDPTCPHH